jgi:hypothetical protein
MRVRTGLVTAVAILLTLVATHLPAGGTEDEPKPELTEAI